MTRNPIRRSQAIAPFGVGAIVEFPRHTLMAAGLDHWPDHINLSLHDERLAKRLGVSYFKSPPAAPSNRPNSARKDGDYLPFVRFPLWYFCPSCRCMTQAKWNDVKIPQCESTFTAKEGAKACSQYKYKKEMIPVRFVIACPNGHIEDFPWDLWAHSRGVSDLSKVTLCDNPKLRFVAAGKSGLEGLIVRCWSCDKWRNLQGAGRSTALRSLQCSGSRPWLGPNGHQQCTHNEPPVMLQRGASNIYFPKVASSILIPPYSYPIDTKLQIPRNWEFISSAIVDGKIDEDRIAPLAKFLGCSRDQLIDAIKRRLGQGSVSAGPTQTEEEFRYAEYLALKNPPSARTGEFVARESKLSNYPSWVQKYFSQIVLVEKLVETRALTGFSRIKPSPYRQYTATDQQNLSLLPKEWLPAVRAPGEGLFLVFNWELVNAWASQPVIDRYGQITAGTPRGLPASFFLLHSFAHALIRRLSFDCGYGSASLRERIYCSESSNAPMCGVLIYTAAGDSEGTMGGLVRMGEPNFFERTFYSSVADSLWCSTDPLCIDSAGQGPDSVNRAACYACSLLPETSCEEGNRYLDRQSLVGTSKNRLIGFFNELVSKILLGEGVTNP